MSESISEIEPLSESNRQKEHYSESSVMNLNHPIENGLYVTVEDVANILVTLNKIENHAIHIPPHNNERVSINPLNNLISINSNERREKRKFVMTTNSYIEKKKSKIMNIPVPFPSPLQNAYFSSLSVPSLQWNDITKFLSGDFKKYQIYCAYEDCSKNKKWHFSIKEKHQDKTTNIIGVTEAEYFNIVTFHYQDKIAAGYILSAICLYWLNPEAQRFVGHRVTEINFIKFERCDDSSERIVKSYFKSQLKNLFLIAHDKSFHFQIKESF
jgi:hypothetical protein